ncbi:hypothetical protein XM38_005420 [Halomicronema hongdechloris C2206]|uniref:Uncharacterized protein n=1 Tax=Halomicronema hongdechloris C2206 TaxID=1641165 RepID=A0A1Z3HH47_9CYAN|nr:hypothetical protein [Halomicronema hongdechloris]ASC69614.1 hypothetical protein XM38_005420 [Halomicronema hongdechloris C2206]
MQTPLVLASALSLVLCSVSPALAESVSDDADKLGPLEPRTPENTYDPNRFNQVSEQINNAVIDAEDENTLSFSDLGLDGFLDDSDGSGSNPSVRVYETMGDPSFGFGTSF